MFRYYKLFDLLQRRGLKVKDLGATASISDPVLAKLRKGDNVNTSILLKICIALNVQPAEIMEYIPEQPPHESKPDQN